MNLILNLFGTKLFNNLMFNPILFSAYHKDDLCNKFLSRKDALKEIEQLQPYLLNSQSLHIQCTIFSGNSQSYVLLHIHETDGFSACAGNRSVIL